MNARYHQGRMDFGHGKIRTNVEDDRLSNLPDDLIHKILSFVSVRQAIKTSVLSSRWSCIWTSMPYLNFSSESETFFPEFVSNVLSHRNNQIQVSSVKLVLIDQESVKEILNYAFSHHVQQLTVTYNIKSNVDQFPLSLFSSQSLKHLTLSRPLYATSSFTATPPWDLPALTTLHLYNIKISDKYTCLFSKCPNLKNLSLSRFIMIETNVFNICHPQLLNLTLEHEYFFYVEAFKVVAPQLKNLTLTHCYGKHLISAPGLTSLVMKGSYPFNLSLQDFPSLEKVDLNLFNLRSEDVHKIVCLLQQIQSIKFLTLNLQILELLYSSKGTISHQPSLFPNLKISKFLASEPVMVYLESTEAKKYQLDTCPSSIFTMVSYEDLAVMRDIATSQTLVAEVWKLLKQSKALRNTNKAHMEQSNAPTESCKRKMHEHIKEQDKKQCAQSSFEMQWHFGEMMEQIKKQHGQLSFAMPCQFGEMMTQTCDMISWLQGIERLLIKLPASKRPVMQATFSSVCEEAAGVTNSMLDFMEIRSQGI